ncbi:MAG: type III secretion system gatekeeper subunit SctW [Zoogloeaceae bacterium]|jgi:type III secretion protein W|nr:type III secretion system gatekeeper subunit SctW [Zoogloeaceae bacterium]
MVGEINVQGQGAAQFHTTAAQAGAAKGFSAGNLAGYAVSVSRDPVSTLADAAEELTFGVDNTKELALKERKSKEGVNASLLDKVKQYQELMDKAGRSENLQLLYAYLKNNRDPRAALQKARESFGDPSQAWAALRQALEDLQGEAPTAALDAIREALKQLEAEEGARIRAGITGALEAGRLANPELGEPLEAGAVYRQAAGDLHDSPEAMFAFILEKYGMEHFEAGLDFLFRSLGSDLASDQPSFEKAHLESVGNSLGQARILNGAHALLGRLLDRWTAVHGVENCAWKPMSLLKEVLALKADHYLSARNLDPVVKDAKPPDIEHEVLFLQELLNTSRQFSPLFFGGVEERMKFIDAVQEAVDHAVAREDEWLARQG